MLPDAISFASENSVSNLTTPYYFPDLLPSDNPNTLHFMKKDATFQGRVHIGYCCRKYGQKDTTKRKDYINPHALIRTRSFIIVVGFTGLVKIQGLSYCNINILCHKFFCWFFCLSPFHPLLYLLNFFCACFLPITLIAPCNIPCV